MNRCILIFSILITTPSIKVFASTPTCYGYFQIATAKQNAAQTLESRQNRFFKPSYSVDSKGALRLQVTLGRNIFEKTLNKISDVIFQFLLKRLGAHVVFPKIKAFLEDTSGDPYFTKLARNFGIQILHNSAQLDTIPKTGPLIIVANHPLSGIDGIALGAIVEKVRPDVKIVLTSLLRDFNGMADHSIFINPFGTATGRAYNLLQRDQMVQHLSDGNAIIIFPSGEVSKKNSPTDSHAVDPQWKKGVANLLQEVPDAVVVPIYVDGQPSQQLLNMKAKYPNLATLMIVKDLTTRLSEPIELVIGNPITAAQIRDLPQKQLQMDYLRARTYALKNLRTQKTSEARVLEEIPSEMDRATIVDELSKLPTLYDQSPDKPEKGFRVVLAKANQIPNILLEIGRLREITFRAVGEGSGKARDLDTYDSYYSHIIVFKKDSGQIAGSYRIAEIDKVLASHGYKGLYTANFFHYSHLAKNLRNGIELGRSFVTPEFQRSLALYALFNGIARFLVQNPRYKHLIGSVSITNDLPDNVKFLMVEFLKRHHGDSHHVNNTTPVRFESLLSPEDIEVLLSDVSSMKDLESRIKDIFGPKTKLPPLIEIYLGLGVRFLSFDFDKDFNTVDGFIWTDLSQQPFDTLKKYMGEDGAASYLNFHNP